MPALDIEQRQVLVDFFQDPDGYRWHHRVLAVPLGGSRWVWITPDHDVEAADLGDHRVVVLTRGQAFPAGRAAETYGFDPFDDGELNGLLGEARSLAEILGVTIAQPLGLQARPWRIADLLHDAFGKEVPPQAIDNEDIWVSKDERALVQIDGSWTYAIRCNAGETEDDFKRRVRGGPGRDRRIAGDREEVSGQRHVPFADMYALLGEHQYKGWPIQGPRGTKEFVGSLRTGGYESFGMYHTDWLRRSGAVPTSGISREHGFICECLRLGAQWDQVDISSLSMSELLVRRLHQIEQATRKNPKAPDFEGLARLVETTTEPGGGAAIPALSSWLAEQQRNEAFVLKQRRLWTEENKTDHPGPKGKKPRDGQGGDG